MVFTFLSAALVVFASATGVFAESHTVKFDNKCGYGTPQLIKGGDVLTTTSYTSSGELAAAIAYLQTGSCGFNGENCTLLELTMTNPVAVGGGSSADISLIDPHTFSVAASIDFYDGCDGVGTTCDSAGCNTAFRQPDDTWVQVACQADNANLLITFCPDGGSSSPSKDTTVKQVATTKAVTTTKAATTTTAVAKTKTTSTSKISAPTSAVAHDSTSTTLASSTPTSTRTCKRRVAERRAIKAHRKRARSL
ncbi:hypothetical protein C8F04DRAFT_1248912 [Mycena alexandri]|uniref:Glycopeptide n=1 Tax=Mycena alexandri TaxID=1745969 RepID=A0AAD6TF87_9AGAR|nr:hypothetical protein C8F04DRAFT_1248912 [Mycena alexandri]